MLKVTQRFDKHCICRLQGEYFGWRFLKPYIGQAVDDEWDMTDLIGGAGERAVNQLAMSTWSRKRGDEKFFNGHVVRIRGDERRRPRSPKRWITFQHSTLLITESRSLH
jgi:hypothetical protein